MIILSNQPEVYHHHDFRLFEMLGANDKAWFNVLWAARAVMSNYDVNGMDLEKAGLCTTFKEALFLPPLRDERNTYG